MESLPERLAGVGERIGTREAEHAEALGAARAKAESLHGLVATALEAFQAAAAKAGSSHLEVGLSAPRLDDKHVRSVEFDVTRGRIRAIVTVKSRGEVTLVGPFKAGHSEGPCRSFAWDASPEIEAALGDFLERFLEEAATP
jgi:hypothetical protein